MIRSGKLCIRPLSATFLRNVSKNGKLAPYLKVICGDVTKKSSHLKKRTEDFMWEKDDWLEFDYNGNDMITVEVWHNKKLLKDKLIGSATWSLESFLGRNCSVDTIPLFFEGQEAGSIHCEVCFTPDTALLNAGAGMAQTNLPANTNLQQPIGGTVVTDTTTDTTLLTQPITTTETKVITHEPIITRETPIVYEKNIIHEKPIITEKTIIHSEQPIIVERPELHERVINEQAEAIVKTEQPVIRQETGMIGEVGLEGATIHSSTEYVKDQAQFYKETPILHQKDVILEQPIIHEKDIIYREKPVVVEKPEIVERHIHNVQAPVVQTHDTLLTQTKEFTTNRPLVGDDAVVVREDAVISQAEPVMKKELPDVHETNVVIEKPIITEKTIVHTEKEMIHEKPEVHEKRIFHQDPTVIKKQEPLVHREGMGFNQ